MKHTVKVTFIILGIFFLAQIIGLLIINNYIDKQQLAEGNVAFTSLPLNVERPVVEQQTSFVYIVIAILIGTAIALALIRFSQMFLWKLWFFVAVFITLSVAFNPFMPELFAVILSFILSLWKTVRPDFYVQNFTELFIYGGLAAIFVPILNIFSAMMLLILISGYDAYAVWKSKHMIDLAKFQTKAKMFAGVIIPYKLPEARKEKIKEVKVKTAILGGGDIGFPLIFAGVIFKDLILKNTFLIAFSKVLIIPVIATLALGWLLYSAKKDKFYPAMPFIATGCFLAYGIMYLTGLL